MKYCETCVFYTKETRMTRLEKPGGWCESPKIAEDWGQGHEEINDMLIYSYAEGGSFWVGPKFGCVHHKTKGD